MLGSRALLNSFKESCKKMDRYDAFYIGAASVLTGCALTNACLDHEREVLRDARLNELERYKAEHSKAKP